jgi:hypothetical protein
MIKVLSMIIGFLVLCIGGLGILLWTAGNQSIDPYTEKGKDYAKTFKASINGTCRGYVRVRLGPLARSEEVMEVTQEICKCAADMTYDSFKHEPPIRLISLVNDSKTQAKAKKIMQECLDRAEIPTANDPREAYESEE